MVQRISLKREPALQMERIAIGNERLVYFLIADRSHRYPNGKRSRIHYIGTTGNGIGRVAASASNHAHNILQSHGVYRLEARIITTPDVSSPPNPNFKTWFKLERACLLAFRDLFGSVPTENGTGHSMKETDEFNYFSKKRVEDIILDLS